MLKEITVLFGIAQIQAGADAIYLANHSTGDMVRPWVYWDFLLVVIKEITQRLVYPLILNICSNTFDRMGMICKTGFDSFHFDSKVDSKAAMNEVTGVISLVWNTNNPEILLNGTPTQGTERTHYALKAGFHVIGPECTILPRTPSKNLIELSRVVGVYGM